MVPLAQNENSQDSLFSKWIGVRRGDCRCERVALTRSLRPMYHLLPTTASVRIFAHNQTWTTRFTSWIVFQSRVMLWNSILRRNYLRPCHVHLMPILTNSSCNNDSHFDEKGKRLRCNLWSIISRKIPVDSVLEKENLIKRPPNSDVFLNFTAVFSKWRI